MVGTPRLFCHHEAMTELKPKKPVRVGVIGWGRFGRLHALTLNRLAEAELVALADAMDHLTDTGKLKAAPVIHQVASVSVGLKDNEALLDLDYAEDSEAGTDANFVMTGSGGLIEVQGSAEGAPFSRDALNALMDLAEKGVADLVIAQNAATS